MEIQCKRNSNRTCYSYLSMVLSPCSIDKERPLHLEDLGFPVARFATIAYNTHICLYSLPPWSGSWKGAQSGPQVSTVFERLLKIFVHGVDRLRCHQLVDQARGTMETHPVSLPTGFQRQPDGDMGLAETRITHQDNRLGLRQIVLLGQVQHLRLVHLRHAVKLELRQFFRHRKASRTDQPLLALHVALPLVAGLSLRGIVGILLFERFHHCPKLLRRNLRQGLDEIRIIAEGLFGEHCVWYLLFLLVDTTLV